MKRIIGLLFKTFLNWARVVGIFRRLRTLLSRSSHRCLIGNKSGLYGDQSSGMMLKLARKLRQTLATWGRTLSYCKMNWRCCTRGTTTGRRPPVSILHKSIAGRYWPVRVAEGPITARYRIIKNASWGTSSLCLFAVKFAAITISCEFILRGTPPQTIIDPPQTYPSRQRKRRRSVPEAELRPVNIQTDLRKHFELYPEVLLNLFLLLDFVDFSWHNIYILKKNRRMSCCQVFFIQTKWYGRVFSCVIAITSEGKSKVGSWQTQCVHLQASSEILSMQSATDFKT